MGRRERRKRERGRVIRWLREHRPLANVLGIMFDTKMVGKAITAVVLIGGAYLVWSWSK